MIRKRHTGVIAGVPIFCYHKCRVIAVLILYNGNPCGKSNGDCVIRAICIATGESWRKVYARLCLQGYIECGWGNFNTIWGNFLTQNGFTRHTMPDGYTVGRFADEHPHGTYILGTGKHAVAVVDGNVIDSWDSRAEIPIYYFEKRADAWQ